MFVFLRLLFGSIDGAEEHAHTRNKVHAKNRKIGFSRNFCSAIYTYSTVYIYIYIYIIIYIYIYIYIYIDR